MKKRLLSLMLCLALLPFALSPEAHAADRLPDQTLMTYYNNSIFAGDSLIRMFRNYVKGRQEKEPDYFSGIKFYSTYSIQLRTLGLEWVVSELSNLVYKGSDQVLCRIVKSVGADKVFILAGLNDNLSREQDGSGIDRGIRYVHNIVNMVRKYSPETLIYFFSLTPVTKKIEDSRHVQAVWDNYNEQLKAACEELDAIYIDIATALKDENGLLPKEITTDNEYHLNEEGNAIWAQLLLDFAQEQYEAGIWTPDQV